MELLIECGAPLEALPPLAQGAAVGDGTVQAAAECALEQTGLQLRPALPVSAAVSRVFVIIGFLGDWVHEL